MTKPMVSPVDRHVSPVRRRLTLEVLLRALVWSWTVALLLTAAWFVAQPWLLPHNNADPRWFVAAGALLLATAAAGIITWRRAPSPLTAALALDERFQLKERTTTLLGLTQEQQRSPAGLALALDVEQRVRGLDIASRFRVRLPWGLLLPPLGAATLLILALLFAPVPTPAGATNTKIDGKATDNPKLVQQGQDELKLALKTEKGKDQPRSEKLQEILREIDQIANNEFDANNKDDVLDQAQKLDAQEKKIEEELAKLQEKQEQEQNLKKELEQLFGKDEPKEGPGQKAEEALGKGDLNQAARELNKLGEDLKNGNLNEAERKQLQEQLQAMKERLDKANEEQKKQEQELEKEKKQAQEQEQKARQEKNKEGEDSAKNKLEELKKIEGELKEREKVQQDLNKLAQQMGQCEKCLKEGDGKAAGKQLADAAKDLGGVESEKQNLENLKQQVENARLKMLAGLDRDGQDGQGGLGGGQRPFAKDGNTASKDAKQQASVDEKSGLVKVGYGQGGNNQAKFAAKDLPGAFRLAKQQAAEATDRQGSTLETVEFERHYFENLAKKKK